MVRISSDTQGIGVYFFTSHRDTEAQSLGYIFENFALPSVSLCLRESNFFEFLPRWKINADALPGTERSIDDFFQFLHNGAMFENRKSVRYRTLAKVRISGLFEGDHLLKDLSITGCCVECSVYADIKTNMPYTIQIFPENAAKIGEFELTVESRWLRATGYSCDVGFTVVESPKGKKFQRYVDYLTWRSAVE